MEGHSFKNGSQLQTWIEHELAHLAAQMQEDALSAEIADRNLSLRMPVAIHLMLYRLAEKLGRSKTAVAEEVLTHAVRDAYAQFDLPKITQADVVEYGSQSEKPIAEKSGIGHRQRRRAE